MKSRWMFVWLAVILCSVAGRAEESFRFRGSGVHDVPAKQAEHPQPVPEAFRPSGVPEDVRPEKSTRGLAGHLLWYLPNRGLDLLDILRLRIRGGPGISSTVRLTDGLEFFVGRHDLYYVGLAESRRNGRHLPRYGRDQVNGLIFMGVDATDDTPYGPDYSPYECGASVNLLLAGVDVGFDPVELWDFAVGLLFIDRMNDDR